MIVDCPSFSEIVSYGVTFFIIGYAIGFKLRAFIRFSENI